MMIGRESNAKMGLNRSLHSTETRKQEDSTFSLHVVTKSCKSIKIAYICKIIQ